MPKLASIRTSLLVAVAATILGLFAAPATATAKPRTGSDVPTDKTMYQDGNDDRYLVGGRWYYRPDADNVGLKQRWQRHRSRSKRWQPIRVPHAWNARVRGHDSMIGKTGWYRKEFRVPDNNSSLRWILRFESVNYRSQVWLNGRPIGRNSGAYLPFELNTPGMKVNGTNILVVRVNNVRKPNDFPPSGLTRDGVPTGGWWNYGGILREVYLRKVDRLDFSNVRIWTDLPCRKCAAKVSVRATVRNHSPHVQRVRLSGRFGTKRMRFNKRGYKLAPGRVAGFKSQFTVKRPRLWSPNKPNLYPVTIHSSGGAGEKQRHRRAGSYSLRFGIRSIKIVNGILMLNGRPLRLRGASIHEDHPGVGMALNRRHRARMFKDLQDMGATMMRTHYPFHPHFLEMADRKGMFVWSEIPMYAMKTKYLKKRETRLLAAKMLRVNVRENRNHASILTWSIANELSSRPGPVQGYYIQRAANSARELDPTRPVSIAINGYPSVAYQSRYEPLDLIGINDYFGWYSGPNDQLVDRNGLGPYLDRMRQDYSNKALMVTEFGAEANRSGPVTEKGTYEFQSDFINFHLDQFDARPWLAGALYWTMQEFRVRPNWSGGNPKPGPETYLHQKAVIGFDGKFRKPGYYELRRRFKAWTHTP